METLIGVIGGLVLIGAIYHQFFDLPMLTTRALIEMTQNLFL